MKKVVKSIISAICCLWSWIYTYRRAAHLKSLRDVIYTEWIRCFMGRVGEYSSIAYPCSLQGGGQNLMTIGNYTIIQSHCILGCWVKYGNQSFTPSIIIGDHCNIGEYCHISACNKIVIGDGLLTGRYVYIGDNSHGGLSLEEITIPPSERKLKSKGEIVIGDNVWVGDKVTVLGGVSIGDNVIIAANSVVNHDVPSNCVVAGVPAKVVKSLI